MCIRDRSRTICSFEAAGTCRFGAQCRFRHVHPPQPCHGLAGAPRVFSTGEGGTDDVVGMLDQLSLSTKKLLVLDANGLLLYRLGHGKERDLRLGKPDCVVRSFEVWLRPGVQEFVRFCQQHFELVVWSSAQLRNFKSALPLVFGEDSRTLLHVMGQDSCTDTGLKHPDNVHKPVFLKELAKLWALRVLRGRFGPSNTLLVDDSVYKTALNPTYTAVHPQEWVPWMQDDDGLQQLTELLRGVAAAVSVPEFLQQSDSQLVCGQEQAKQHFEAIPELLEYMQRSSSRRPSAND
eukprot:TRINITY_DN28870_c0_g1_i1.p1 TRINITY_DN28870_c0_g1~~TRINITY_DN28870_c0_g1_i1.p1  ORF type:complete len:292 (+),score=58.43 TRINITY_DN28870_c0_g1_i1:109-984(+)